MLSYFPREQRDLAESAGKKQLDKLSKVQGRRTMSINLFLGECKEIALAQVHI
jgi:hypothetical protein